MSVQVQMKLMQSYRRVVFSAALLSVTVLLLYEYSPLGSTNGSYSTDSIAENSSQRFCFNGFNQSATQLMMALSIKKNFSEKLHSELSNASLTNLCYRDEPLVIVILATWRSGSTFLASLIREIPGTFYSFEPFHSLRSGLVNRGTLGDAHNIFKAIVDCDFRMSQKYLNHVHRTKWLAAHNKRYDDVCNSSKTLCFNAAFYSDVCSQFPIRLVKIVRLKVTQFITFLEGRRKGFENWRVIQLFRDPRGLFSSRKDEVIWKWCSKNPSCSNSKIACQNLLEDYRLGQEKLKVIFGTERFMVLKYEDLALHPQVTAESLLSFLGFRKPFPKSVMDFVTLNTSRDYLNSKEDSRYSVARNSSSRVSAWKKDLSESDIKQTKEDCREYMEELGYTPS